MPSIVVRIHHTLWALGMLTSAFAVQYGSTVIAGLTQVDASVNPNVRADVGIGSQFPQFAVIDSITPKIVFQSRAIAAALAVTGATGAKIDNTNTLKVYWVELVDGVPEADGEIYTCNRGLLLPRQLQASHRGDATLGLEALLYSSDGATDPIIVSNGAVPAIVQDNIRHTLKEATLAAVALANLTDVTIDFGVNANTIGTDSDIYDKLIVKDGGVTPNISITTLKTDLLGTGIPLAGKKGTHANTSITLRQYETDGIGFSSSDDIVITADGLATYQSTSGQGPARAQAVVRVDCTWDGTNAPLVIT